MTIGVETKIACQIPELHGTAFFLTENDGVPIVDGAWSGAAEGAGRGPSPARRPAVPAAAAAGPGVGRRPSAWDGRGGDVCHRRPKTRPPPAAEMPRPRHQTGAGQLGRGSS